MGEAGQILSEPKRQIQNSKNAVSSGNMKEQNPDAPLRNSDSVLIRNPEENIFSDHRPGLGTVFSTTFILTVATAFLYALGYGYQRGYVEAWGVDTDLFTLSIQQYLVYGSQFLSQIGVIGGAFWLLITVVLLAAPYLLNKYVAIILAPDNIISLLKRAILKHNQETDASDWLKQYIVRLFINFQTLLMAVMIFGLYLIVTSFASKVGRQVAENELKTLSEQNEMYSANGFSKVKRFETKQNTFDALVIAANDRFYALYIPASGGKRLLTIPTSSILSVIAEVKPPRTDLPELKSSPQKSE